jgi:hypothetical protein
MPFALFFPFLLRLAGPIAFLGAAIVAGVMNRSFVLVPLLALAATATTIIIRKVTPSPAMNLQSMLDPNAAEVKPNLFKGLGPRFAMGLVGYAFAFGIAALIAAVFQATEFEPRVLGSDLAFLIVPALLAFVGAWVSARLGLNQMASMMGEMQGMFSQMQTGQGPANDDDAFTVEGEVIDPDEPRS